MKRKPLSELRRRHRLTGGSLVIASAVLGLACGDSTEQPMLHDEPDDVVTEGYGVRDLRPLPPVRSSAHDINDGGDIVGVVDGRAVLWLLDAEARASDPVELALAGGGDPGPSEAMGVNEFGQVVGALTPDRPRPFIWTASGGLRELPLPPGAEAAVAYDINDAGHIVGSASADPIFGTAENGWVVVWVVDEEGELLDVRDIGTMGGTGARGHAIDQRGSIAGMIWNEGSLPSGGFVWHAMADIEELPLEGETLGMNDRGAVVGSFDGKAAVWRGGVLEEVGPPGSVARAINDEHVVVGEIRVGARSATRAGFVIVDGGLQALEALSMVEHGRPRAINDAGIIVGDVFTAGPDVSQAVYWVPR